MHKDPCDNPAPAPRRGLCCAALRPYVRGSAGLGAPAPGRLMACLAQPFAGGRRIKRTRRDPRVTDRTSPVSGVAGRYAAALFDLALDEDELDTVEADLNLLSALIDGSADLRRLVHSPVFSADEQQRAIGAVADRAGVGGTVGNVVRLMAKNRRLFALPGVIRGFMARLAAHRGEVSAEVVSARPLTEEQAAALEAALKESLGKEVAVEARVDPAILGGLIVRVGSRMIDGSIRSRLNSMKTQLKGIG
jgi:F-type H+-transporting ATPase subunit delta